MNASASPLLSIFEKKLRLEVPLFQRQYVWGRDQQWEPLWEDISRKFSEHLMDRKEAPVHFLGAMVLDQKQTPVTHVEKRQVIDGQQRLTTIQLFLAALRDFCRSNGCEELADECESFILNRGKMADPEVDKFKVWPTAQDRPVFAAVLEAGSRNAVDAKYPLHYKKYARKPDPRPRLVDAYLYFHAAVSEFFLGTEEDPPLAGQKPLEKRLDECLQALKNTLHVAVIDLDPTDDAQVIFETLNARGEPLLPADLLRNYIFLRAARGKEPQEQLYETHWKPFDEDFWRVEVRQGRLNRPRSDLFMQHYLTSQQAVDIPVKHLYVEYKFWIERSHPFASVAAELASLAAQREHFKRLQEPKSGDPLAPLARFLQRFDISTVYPLLLFLMRAGLSDDELRSVGNTIESYLVRRAVCSLTAKNYNRVFLTLIRNLQQTEVSPAQIRAHLSTLRSESGEWPTDDVFAEHWNAAHAYSVLGARKVFHILERLNETYYTSRTERISIDGELTVEHLMPQNWFEHWPLSDGQPGLDYNELFQADDEDPRAQETRRRSALVQTLGNLTVITQPLNSSISNASWTVKHPEIMKSSLLPINLQLHSTNVWTEESILSRSGALFERALDLWPAPDVR